MRPVILYVTMSADGFIADSDGGVGWLSGAAGEDYGYADFYDSVDTVLLGRTTYEQILGSGGDFPYADKPVYVFASDAQVRIAADNVTAVSDPAPEFVARLKLDDAGRIWLGGGSALATSLWNAGLVDELHLFVQPIMLGDGLPFIGKKHRRRGLELIEAKSWPADLVELHYRVTGEWRADVSKPGT